MYYAVVEWWDSIKEEDIFSHMIICANSYAEAMEYIEEAFDEIDSLEIRVVNKEQSHIIFLPLDHATAVIEENIW